MDVTLSIPDAQFPRARAALAASVGWLPEHATRPTNPETEAQAARRAILQFVRRTTRQHEVNALHDAAHASARAQEAAVTDITVA